jgi:hypothetical protein
MIGYFAIKPKISRFIVSVPMCDCLAREIFERDQSPIGQSWEIEIEIRKLT